MRRPCAGSGDPAGDPAGDLAGVTAKAAVASSSDPSAAPGNRQNTRQNLVCNRITMFEPRLMNVDDRRISSSGTGLCTSQSCACDPLASVAARRCSELSSTAVPRPATMVTHSGPSYLTYNGVL